MGLTATAKNDMLVELGSQALYVTLIDSNSNVISTKQVTFGSTGAGSPSGRQIDIVGTYEFPVPQGVWPRYVAISKDVGGLQTLSDNESTGVPEAYATSGTLTLTNFTITLL